MLLRELSALRVVVLQVKGSATDAEATRQRAASSRGVEQLDLVMGRLSSRGVVVVCSLRGSVAGDALLLCLSAHYRIIDAQANLHCDGEGTSLRAAAFRTLHADDAHCWLQEGCADSSRAVELGIASERLDDATDERALQFAQWLVCQPPVGVCHMLLLTCPVVEDRDRQATAKWCVRSSSL